MSDSEQGKKIKVSDMPTKRYDMKFHLKKIVMTL